MFHSASGLYPEQHIYIESGKVLLLVCSPSKTSVPCRILRELTQTLAVQVALERSHMLQIITDLAVDYSAAECTRILQRSGRPLPAAVHVSSPHSTSTSHQGAASRRTQTHQQLE